MADDGTLLVVGAAPTCADLNALPAYGDVSSRTSTAVATARSLVPDVVIAPLDAPGLGVLDALAARNHTRTAVLVGPARVARGDVTSAAIDDVVTTPFVPAGSAAGSPRSFACAASAARCRRTTRATRSSTSRRPSRSAYCADDRSSSSR